MTIVEHTEGLVPGPAAKASSVRIHGNLVQGSDEWIAARRGMLTASETKLIVTPTFKVAENDKQRAHLYELLAQRITGYVEPHYISDDMLRGMEDEFDALTLYSQHYAPTETVGFITNDKWGFTLGYSPDGLVGTDGLVEIKSRRQRFQVETFVNHVIPKAIPSEYLLQVQTGMMVSERDWCDLISYSGGLPMAVIRVHANDEIQENILTAAEKFEAKLTEAMARYREAVAVSGAVPTVRVDREIVL
ncbi:YqaJ-like viral recombinase [Methylobacterium sp. W2]|uniref:lambda exonuclease family protein n=1 Tax=Methylobacterium sp. W2 TaxID=2598107 RepID=UPI001D0C086C|nr:lambda exonuclease family protein [Methylobacterium sp. W2]MCC0807547.1 YqaJ-like viral recombinase [Methylobacterium sp. W2]